MHDNDSTALRTMANGLKSDAKALWREGNKDEAMRLFGLFRRIVRELHWRKQFSHQWN